MLLLSTMQDEDDFFMGGGGRGVFKLIAHEYGRTNAAILLCISLRCVCSEPGFSIFT